MTTTDRNPYCSRCGRHLGMPFHETNEHDEAVSRHTDEEADEHSPRVYPGDMGPIDDRWNQP